MQVYVRTSGVAQVLTIRCSTRRKTQHARGPNTQCFLDFNTQGLRRLFYHGRAIALGQEVNGGDMSAGHSDVAAPQGLSDIKDPKAPSENNSYVALSDLTLQGYGVPTHIISR